MFNYANFDYALFAMLIKSCVLQAKNVCETIEDSGTANNDMVLLSNLKNKREDAFEQHGLDLIKGEPGYFYLNEQLGQARRNVEFCLMVSELLRQKGITSSVVKVRD